MKNIKFAIATIAAFATFAVHAETVKLTVDGMVCAFCAGAIEKKMKANKETSEVFVSLENKIVAVSQKSGQKLDDAKLKAQIADAGYEVKAIERVSTSIADIKAATKAKKS
ncbi:MAG: copper chaperone [Betaproteobacteria bacterium]|nr:MAG: copper chaperone [Betaproteobacteria bacterium]